MMAVHAVLGRFDSGSERGSEGGLVLPESGTFGRINADTLCSSMLESRIWRCERQIVVFVDAQRR